MRKLFFFPHLLCPYIAITFCLFFYNQAFAAKFFKITYTSTEPSESIETVANQFITNDDKEAKAEFIQNIKNRNPQIIDWNNIPIQSTLTILISEKDMTNSEVQTYIATEEKKSEESALQKKAELDALQNNFLRINQKLQRHSLMAGYFLKTTHETNGHYTIQSNFVRLPSFGHEYIYLHNINKWKIENLLYHTIINLYPSKESNDFKVPVTYSLGTEIIWDNLKLNISPYWAFKYELSANISEDDEGFLTRINKNLSTGLGISYSYYLNKMKIWLATDYLIDLSSSSTGRNNMVENGGINGAMLALKIRCAYAYNIQFIDSWFIETIYTTGHRQNASNDIKIVTNSIAINWGFSF